MADDERHYTGGQIIAIKLGKLGVNQRNARLDAIAQIIGRPILSSNELTVDETHTVIAYLDTLDSGDIFQQPKEQHP